MSVLAGSLMEPWVPASSRLGCDGYKALLTESCVSRHAVYPPTTSLPNTLIPRGLCPELSSLHAFVKVFRSSWGHVSSRARHPRAKRIAERPSSPRPHRSVRFNAASGKLTAVSVPSRFCFTWSSNRGCGWIEDFYRQAGALDSPVVLSIAMALQLRAVMFRNRRSHSRRPLSRDCTDYPRGCRCDMPDRARLRPRRL